MSYLERAREVVDVEISGMLALRGQLDERFDQAVGLIVEALGARSKVVVIGVGKSGNVGRKIAATLTSTGCPAVALDPISAMHGDLGIIGEGDVVIALSYSGETDELISLLPAVKRFRIRLIAVTGHIRSTLAECADVVLPCKVPKEACPFNLAPTTSTTAMMVLGDALAMAVLDARGFRRKDFARNHPAGAIGRALLLKVKDIMRTGDRLPVVNDSKIVRDALLSMTSAKSGSVCVVNARGKLVGVFTDGDLRRLLSLDEGVLNKAISMVMTSAPVTIRETALAAEALRIFDARNVDDLVVINSAHMPVGIIDSQDLPRLKLM